MSMSADKMRLNALTKELWAKWQRTQESWQDAKSQEFEKKYLEELQVAVDRTVSVIDQLDKLVARIRSDCA